VQSFIIVNNTHWKKTKLQVQKAKYILLPIFSFIQSCLAEITLKHFVGSTFFNRRLFAENLLTIILCFIKGFLTGIILCFIKGYLTGKILCFIKECLFASLKDI